MKRITVRCEEPSLVRVAADLLRVYYPGIIVDEEGTQTPLLTIERINQGQGFRLTWSEGEFSVSREERFSVPEFYEEEINRERRILRLTLHKLLAKELGVVPSPWGVLTGVRPIKIVHRLLEQGFSEAEVRFYLERDYGIRNDKACLVTGTALYQQPYLLSREDAGRLIGLYVDIPFCPTRCHYCSFPSFSLARWGKYLEAYLVALEQELQKTGELIKREEITVQTVYVGGGTPTILSAEQLDRLLNAIETCFDLTGCREITVEGGRPDTLDREKLEVLKKHGVNRLSINPQTMCETTLQKIGRCHSVNQVLEAYRTARDCEIPIINMDLIIGLPGENLETVSHTLREVLNLNPENITLHALAIKRAAYYRQEGVDLPAREEGEAMMSLAQRKLSEKGYLPYYLYRQKEILAFGENVGYTLPGEECIYNIQMIEERQTILGFGVGAGSKIVHPADWSVDNFYNPKDLLVYLDRLPEIIHRKVDKVRGFLYNY